MKKIYVFILICLGLCGCWTIEPQVQTTKSWENHYFNTNDFTVGTSNIKLDKGESIWVLSNTTLSRLLKNVKDK